MTTLKHIKRKPSENIVEKGENADKPSENIVKKGENADKQQFLLPQCFLTSERQNFFSNVNSVVSKCFQFGQG